MFKAFKVTLGIFAALAVVFVVILVVGNTVEWITRPQSTPLSASIENAPPTASLAGGSGLTYLKHSGVYHGLDYCNIEGYGIPAGELDHEDGSNWLNDPACK